MRIHTSATEADVRAAAMVARATIAGFSQHGSRSREYAFEVRLTGESSRWPNGGRDTDGGKAATWDQWGVFLAALYRTDPQLVCWAYNGAYEFHMRTAERFLWGKTLQNGWPEDAHGDHSWEWGHWAWGAGAQCRRCSARQVRT